MECKKIKKFTYTGVQKEKRVFDYCVVGRGNNVRTKPIST